MTQFSANFKNKFFQKFKNLGEMPVTRYNNKHFLFYEHFKDILLPQLVELSRKDKSIFNFTFTQLKNLPFMSCVSSRFKHSDTFEFFDGKSQKIYTFRVYHLFKLRRVPHTVWKGVVFSQNNEVYLLYTDSFAQSERDREKGTEELERYLYDNPNALVDFFG